MSQKGVHFVNEIQGIKSLSASNLKKPYKDINRILKYSKKFIQNADLSKISIESLKRKENLV